MSVCYNRWRWIARGVYFAKVEGHHSKPQKINNKAYSMCLFSSIAIVFCFMASLGALFGSSHPLKWRLSHLRILAVKISEEKKDPNLVTVGNLVFKPGQSVRLELNGVDLAADEAKYAKVLRSFLARAQTQREAINTKSDKLQVKPLAGVYKTLL